MKTQIKNYLKSVGIAILFIVVISLIIWLLWILPSYILLTLSILGLIVFVSIIVHYHLYED